MTRWTDDPLADFDSYDREQAMAESKLPHCDHCGEAIYEYYYEINGEIVCEECLEINYKKWVEE